MIDLIRTIAITHDQEVRRDLPLEALADPEIAWYWVDFNEPTHEEGMLLQDHFRFHPLAIEDCFHFTQRPKIDHYTDYQFYVLHALNQLELTSEEVDLFVGANFIVSFHMAPLREIESVWEQVPGHHRAHKIGPLFVAYLIMDKLVDQYFPSIYQIEEHLDTIEDNTRGLSVKRLMNQVFNIRSDLLQLRRTIFPMRDLLYRVLHAEHMPRIAETRVYFTDVYDHLLKLSEMIESNREMTADLRDSYLSVNSNRMNSIMMVLTVITTIFMPLTLLAGIYGMNFENMPELRWHYGYYAVLVMMGSVAAFMFWWFRRKGWFED